MSLCGESKALIYNMTPMWSTFVTLIVSKEQDIQQENKNVIHGNVTA